MLKAIVAFVLDETVQNIALCVVCALVYQENWIGFLL